MVGLEMLEMRSSTSHILKLVWRKAVCLFNVLSFLLSTDCVTLRVEAEENIDHRVMSIFSRVGSAFAGLFGKSVHWRPCS
jgi:hypothetical protein